MTKQTRVKGVEKDRTNKSTRECYKIAKQAKIQKNNSSKERKEMSTRVHNKQNQSTRRQDDFKQTLRHRSTKVKNKHCDTETQGYKIGKKKGEQAEKTNKKITIIYKSAEQTSRHHSKKTRDRKSVV
mgnify:CR=1 FL=1